MSIILSSIFLYSFRLAKYSCNPFLLLSIIFLLGEVLYLKTQTESESCSEEPGKKGADSKCQWLWYVWASRWVWYSFLNLPYKWVRGVTHLAASLILLPSLCVLFHISFLSAIERMSYGYGCWAVSLHSHVVQMTTKQIAHSDEQGLSRAGWSIICFVSHGFLELTIG